MSDNLEFDHYTREDLIRSVQNARARTEFYKAEANLENSRWLWTHVYAVVATLALGTVLVLAAYGEAKHVVEIDEAEKRELDALRQCVKASEK